MSAIRGAGVRVRCDRPESGCTHPMDAFGGLLRLHGMNAVPRCVVALLILKVAQHCRLTDDVDDRPDARFGQLRERRCRPFAERGSAAMPVNTSRAIVRHHDRHARDRSTRCCPLVRPNHHPDPATGTEHRRRRCSPSPAVGGRMTPAPRRPSPGRRRRSRPTPCRSDVRRRPHPPPARPWRRLNSRRTGILLRRGRDRLQLRHSRRQRRVESIDRAAVELLQSGRAWRLPPSGSGSRAASLRCPQAARPPRLGSA